MEQRRESYQAVIGVARDLTASLAAVDRYSRLIEAVRRVIPCDAACLLRLEGQELVPLATHGLVPEVLSRRFERGRHPRLDAILGSEGPVRFPADSSLPDPFDGLVVGDHGSHLQVHDCMGCRLTFEDQVVGALTADALGPAAFDGVDPRLLETLGVLAGAAMRTTGLIEALERTAERRGEVARTLQRSALLAHGGEILGTSEPMRHLLGEIRIVAESDLTVLITGETGVGKELVARAIHESSTRRDEALIEVNCAALPESIAESELFGHVKGAFTGAVRDRSGKFEIADGGTLLLDEIGELPLTLQPKLLRALQYGEIQRVGSDRKIRVDVRILAATNRDLAREVAAGRFRADLYHRLAVYPLRVPPLRDRSSDVPLLASHFLDAGRRRLGLGPVRLAEAARERLAAAEWPGNVRELENVISRGLLRATRAGGGRGGEIVVGCEHLDLEGDGAVAGASGSAGSRSQVSIDPGARPPADTIDRSLTDHGVQISTSPAARAPNDIGVRLRGGVQGAHDGSARGPASGSPPRLEEPTPPRSEDHRSLAERVDEFRRREITAVVERHGGNWAAAARELGLHRSNLHHIARRLGLR